MSTGQERPVFSWVAHSNDHGRLSSDDRKTVSKQVMREYLRKNPRALGSSTAGRTQESRLPNNAAPEDRTLESQAIARASLTACWRADGTPLRKQRKKQSLSVSSTASGPDQTRPSKRRQLSNTVLSRSSPTAMASTACQWPSMNNVPLSELQDAIEWQFNHQDLIAGKEEGWSIWLSKVKRGWQDDFYGFATSNEAHLNLFLCVSAHKKARITGSEQSKAYLTSKGRVLELVSNEVSTRSGQLDGSSSTMVGMLAMLALAEGDVDAARMHLQAFRTLVRSRSKHISPRWKQSAASTSPSSPSSTGAHEKSESDVTLPVSDDQLFDVFEADLLQSHVAALTGDSTSPSPDGLRSVEEVAYSVILRIFERAEAASSSSSGSEDTLAIGDAITHAASITYWAFTRSQTTGQRSSQVAMCLQIYYRFTKFSSVIKGLRSRTSVIQTVPWCSFYWCAFAHENEIPVEAWMPEPARSFFTKIVRANVQSQGIETYKGFVERLKDWPFTCSWSEKRFFPVWSQLGIGSAAKESRSYMELLADSQ